MLQKMDPKGKDMSFFLSCCIKRVNPEMRKGDGNWWEVVGFDFVFWLDQ